jgi:hypothetical protein
MANGHSVNRRGFFGEDDLIKGHKINDDVLIGGDGDDVIIGFGGSDQLVGEDGEDDLSGGAGNDLLVGAIWADGDTDTETDGIQGNGIVDAADTFAQDDYSDDFDAGADAESNGTDTIWYYDADASAGEGATEGVVDIIDLSDATDFVDGEDENDTIDQAEMEEQLNAAFHYHEESGELDDGDNNTWFEVYSDAGGTAAETVYVEVDGNQFMWDGDSWGLVA